ncbi:hypothetical protein ACH5RR_005341 [Cinchona calisaya]|uniref:Uncharacterized protein n=1 Tax=Cinchona calisaya TaxID=153742 RepID=A0ABD3AKY1_9GENT
MSCCTYSSLFGLSMLVLAGIWTGVLATCMELQDPTNTVEFSSGLGFLKHTHTKKGQSDHTPSSTSSRGSERCLHVFLNARNIGLMFPTSDTVYDDENHALHSDAGPPLYAQTFSSP